MGSLYRLSPDRESKAAIGTQFETGIANIKYLLRYSQCLWKHKNYTMAIELLLTTFFFTYMRPLVEAGKLYRAVTPLYIATLRGKKYYLYTEKELSDWKASHPEKYELVHCKG